MQSVRTIATILVVMVAVITIDAQYRIGGYLRYHNSLCLHRSVDVHMRKGDTTFNEEHMTCQKIRIQCSDLAARLWLQQTLRFDNYRANCTSIVLPDKPCEYPAGCVHGIEREFYNEFYQITHKLCVGVTTVVDGPVIIPVRYASLPPNLPDFNRYVFFDDLKPRTMRVDTDGGYHKFDPVVVCQHDDVYARILPKFVLNQLTNESHYRPDFLIIDSSTQYTTVMLNVNPRAKSYYDSDIFPLPFLVDKYRYNGVCNSTFRNGDIVPCKGGTTRCVVTSMIDYKCEAPTVIPPYMYCLDQYYMSKTPTCINALSTVSVQAVPNLLNYIVWSIQP